MIDVEAIWKLVRTHVPEKKRLKVLTELVDIAENDGWDQAGYMHCDWKQWPEVKAYCKEKWPDEEEE